MKYYIENLFTDESLVIIATTTGENPTNLIKEILSRTQDYIKTSDILRLEYGISIIIEYKQNINTIIIQKG